MIFDSISSITNFHLTIAIKKLLVSRFQTKIENYFAISHAISYSIYIAIFPRKSAHAFSFMTMQVFNTFFFQTLNAKLGSLSQTYILIHTYLRVQIRYEFFSSCFYICTLCVLAYVLAKNFLEWNERIYSLSVDIV